MHRPSPATAISLAALVFAMSGTAYAATGGDFLLGKANTATSVTALTNSKGTALSLSASPATPPLKVSNSVQVPSLNASELGGHTSSAFLPTNGTAANSSELGGQPATDYTTGGQIAIDTATVASGVAADVTVPSAVSKDYGLQLECFDGMATPSSLPRAPPSNTGSSPRTGSPSCPACWTSGGKKGPRAPQVLPRGWCRWRSGRPWPPPTGPRQ